VLDPEYIQTLKIVSRVKHRILANYLAPWGSILGSSHKALGYIDCFAGGGIYKDETGTFLQGSPAIALQLAKSYVLAGIWR
jgi:three-Cys-motif partner protein